MRIFLIARGSTWIFARYAVTFSCATGKAGVDKRPSRSLVLHQVDVGRELGARVDPVDQMYARQNFCHVRAQPYPFEP